MKFYLKTLLFLVLWAIISQNPVRSMGWVNGAVGWFASEEPVRVPTAYGREEVRTLFNNGPVELRSDSFPESMTAQHIPFHQSSLKNPESAIGQLVVCYQGGEKIDAQLTSFSLQLRHVITDHPIESVGAYVGLSVASVVLPSSLVYACVGVAAAGWGVYQFYYTNPNYIRSFLQNHRDWSGTLTAVIGANQTFGHILNQNTLKVTGLTPHHTFLFTGALPAGLCGVCIEYTIELQPVHMNR